MKQTRIASFPILAGIALFLAGGQTGVGAQTTVAPPPALINFQGRLAKPDGTPVTDGNTYAVTLSLWDAQSGGAKRWEQTFSNVTVRNGVFAVLLNLNNGFTSGNTLDSTLNNNTYLQVQVGTNAALTPRQQLVSNAYALKAATVADGSISVSKLTTDLKNSILGGPAGGDLMGNYPSPQIKTDSSLLNKVSGTLLYIAATTSMLDQSQPTTTATVTSSAWQSFTPGTTGTLVEIDVQCGTAGAQVPTTLSLYAGPGTTSTPIQTIPITINPALGLQSFPITANVTAGQVYTWSIGSNNNLTFGYAGGNPYTGGRADLGTQYDYQFQTKMQVTTAPATQINASASIFQTGSFYLSQNASVGPMLVKQYDPFTSGTYNTIGRSGLFQAASDTLFGGMADPAAGARSIRFGNWSADGATRADVLSVFNNGRVGIGTTSPVSPLHVVGDSRITGKLNLGTTLLTTGETLALDGNARMTGNLKVEGTTGLTLSGSGSGITFQDGTTQKTAPVFQGATAGGDLTGTYPNPTIGSGKVTTAKILDGSVTTAKIADGNVTTIKILDGNVTTAKILDGNITTIKIQDSSVNNNKLASDASSLSKVSGATMVSNGGNIGIGTANPAFRLHIVDTTFPTVQMESSNTTGTWLRLINTSAGGHNWNVVSSGSGNTEGPGKLLFNDQTTGGMRMQIASDGGVTIPGYMYINGSTQVNYSKYGWLNVDGNTSTSSGIHDYSLVASQRIAALEFNAFSDVRLKRLVGHSDAFRDLNTLLGIEVMDYTMRDTVAYGNRPYKKVVAQQVETVYPQAVTRTTGAIPDIYQRAKVDHGWVQLASNLKVGERVQLLTPKGSAVYKVLDVMPQGFRVDLPNASEAFVYGREVADLRTVDYEAIAMLNVSATQVLYRQLDDLKARSVESETNLVDLKAKNAAMQVENAAIKARLDALEAALNRMKSAPK